MPLDLYHVFVPTIVRGLENLDVVLKKGETYASENGVAPEKLLEASLHLDMKGLIFQIQRASDSAKLGAVRLAGTPNEVMEDNEKTFADLHARIAKTIKFLQGADKAGFEGSPDADLTMKQGGQELTFTRQSYCLNFAIPNFFFHATTAYDILRAQGVPVGKIDYLAGRDGSSTAGFQKANDESRNQ